MGVSDKGDMQSVQCWGGSRNVFGNPCIRACSHILVIEHGIILVSSHGCCSHTHLVEGVSAERILSLCVFEPQAGGMAAAEESLYGGGVRGDGCTGVSGHHPAEPPWPCPARKASFPRPAVQVRRSWISWQGPRHSLLAY